MLATFSAKVFKWFGWKIEGEFPQEKKLVCIFGPHTSNWDFMVLLLVKWMFKIKPTFIGKHTLFVGPLGWFLRKIGGIPVDRRSSHNVVSQIVDVINSREKIFFALAPEGTRSKLPRWKSGFYHIAHEAAVPIQCVYMDCDRKVIGWGPIIKTTGNLKEDFENKIKPIYHGLKGIRPGYESDLIINE